MAPDRRYIPSPFWGGKLVSSSRRLVAATTGLFALILVTLLAPSELNGVWRVVAQDAGKAGAGAAPEAPGKYLGATTCDSASCHTKPEARERPPYLTEYTSWSAMDGDVPYDRHSYAWRRLRSAEKGGDDASPAIMAKLNELEGTKETAEKSARCLSCHAVSVHDYGVGEKNPGAPVALHRNLQGARYRPEEGVTCDGCHGPAEKWLKAHEKENWTIEEWKKLGGPNGGSQKLYDQHGIFYSKDLVLWADQCIRCHLRIDTNMLDAGHPDLLPFELFGHNQQVPHWRDYSFEEPSPELPGAGPMHAARQWQTGQAAALRSAFEQLRDRASGAAFNRPDPAHLRAGLDRAVGHWAVVQHAITRSAPDSARALGSHFEALRAAIPAEGDIDVAKVTTIAGEARAAVAPLVRTLADAAIDAPAVVQLMKAIATESATATSAPAGEQARLGLYALNYARLVATDPDALSADPPTDKAMLAIYALYDVETGTPEFATALQAVGKALE